MVIVILLLLLINTIPKLKIKDYVKANGIISQAEILGYYRHIKHGYGRNSVTEYFTVFKFSDINGIEHITMDTINNTLFIKYKVGDVITIKYIENSLIDDEKIKSKVLKYAFNIKEYNKIRKQYLDSLRKKFNKNYFSEISDDTISTNTRISFENKLNKGYFSTIDEDISLTDNSNVYSFAFETKRTKSIFTNQIFIVAFFIIFIILCIFILFIIIFKNIK